MHLKNIFKDPNWKKIFITKTGTLCAVVVAYYLLTWFTGCPFRYFFGISCPGCGMTRALLAALRLDFVAAFSYHPLFFLLPFFLLAYYLDPWIDWNHHYVLLGSVVALFVLTYLIRLLFFHDPIVAWHPSSGVFFKSFFHFFINIQKLPG